jgi:hypothetical protein
MSIARCSKLLTDYLALAHAYRNDMSCRQSCRDTYQVHRGCKQQWATGSNSFPGLRAMLVHGAGCSMVYAAYVLLQAALGIMVMAGCVAGEMLLQLPSCLPVRVLQERQQSRAQCTCTIITAAGRGNSWCNLIQRCCS